MSTMLKQWQAVEEESVRLVKLINEGTDQHLVKHLHSTDPILLRSVIPHTVKHGETALHLAGVRERVDSLRFMLKNKVDVNTRNGFGHSPLYACLCHNSVRSARLLVDFGADVNEIVCREVRESLLHRMIKGNRAHAVELLLEANAAIEAATKDGDTPLHYTARYNRPKITSVLIEMGADINATNIRKETPLHVSITNGTLEVAKILVKNKASTSAKDRQGMTALHSAVATNALELVRLMLTNISTQVNSKEVLLGRTPLLLACSNGKQKMVALLLSHGADANLTTNSRKSVLHVAASSGKADVLCTVIKRMQNLNALSINNITPLHCAVVAGHADIVKMLLKAGVNISMKDIDGNTALHMAAQAGNNQIVAQLLHYGVQVNTTNMSQRTALHLAFMAGHENTGWILIRAGCDPEIMDVEDARARDYLEEFRRSNKQHLDIQEDRFDVNEEQRIENGNQDSKDNHLAQNDIDLTLNKHPAIISDNTDSGHEMFTSGLLLSNRLGTVVSHGQDVKSFNSKALDIHSKHSSNVGEVDVIN